MNGEDAFDVACDCDLTVEHILVECGDLQKLDKDIIMLRIYNSYSRKLV